MLSLLASFALFPFALIGLLVFLGVVGVLLCFVICALFALGAWIKETCGDFALMLVIALSVSVGGYWLWRLT